ncbi:hypothetical protein A2U01_0052920, partial [Trifolium medium]|nr:hypothetical protein [Trifolium medium]
MNLSWMKAGTASLEEKKKRHTVKIKKLRRFVIPCKVSFGFLNIVAIMIPMKEFENFGPRCSGVPFAG